MQIIKLIMNGPQFYFHFWISGNFLNAVLALNRLYVCSRERFPFTFELALV